MRPAERAPIPAVGALVPPLEETLRTKWKDAAIDWNGTDPLL